MSGKVLHQRAEVAPTAYNWPTLEVSEDASPDRSKRFFQLAEVSNLGQDLRP